MCSDISAIPAVSRCRFGRPRAVSATECDRFDGFCSCFFRSLLSGWDVSRLEWSGPYARTLASHQKGDKMTGIVLSASVRQNLLSLQSTASLLATTQNDLATGNKVNSALDNPTSYFTAAALNNRASDISNLLDGIGNGVQVLQAANTGITSLQSLVASAQSVANQVLQTPIGYSAKSSVSTSAISGANANNLLGTGTGYTDATFAGATATGTITAAFTSATATGTAVNNDDTTSVPITTTTQLVGTAGTTSNDLPSG